MNWLIATGMAAETTVAAAAALMPTAMIVLAGGMSRLPKWYLPVTAAGLVLSVLAVVFWVGWAPQSGLEFWGWASAVLSGYVGLMAILALAAFIRRYANPDDWVRTKWLRGLLGTKKQREAAEAAKDSEAYEKGYPDRSR